jgi:hypothetical protein
VKQKESGRLAKPREGETPRRYTGTHYNTLSAAEPRRCHQLHLVQNANLKSSSFVVRTEAWKGDEDERGRGEGCLHAE